ncbi:MAG TPA: hypothetical protein VEU08_12995 [Vicinamibacterales bacterium]|nr:hypothetical protein [Vicinamibacterales bacterium]
MNLLVPVGLLFAVSIVRLVKLRTLTHLLQAVSMLCLVVVVLTHVAEGEQWWTSMGWGQPHSVGHYIDLTSAVLTIAFLSISAFLQFASTRR